MALEDLIVAERERYVSWFPGALAEASTNYSETVGELLISINHDALPYPFRYLRVDALGTNAQGERVSIQFDLSPGHAFEPSGFDFGAFVVEAYPFEWDKVQFAFDRAPPNPAQIAGWITRWLDVEDTGVHASNGLSGAIHSFTEIETNGEWWFLTGDFGTAPAEAMIEFIELLGSQGLKRIVIRTA